MESTTHSSHVDLFEQHAEKTLTGDVLPKQEKVGQTEKAELSLGNPAGGPTTCEGTEYPKGPQLALITLALCLGVFLVALGTFALSYLLAIRS
jgi:hypothetical protein